DERGLHTLIDPSGEGPARSPEVNQPTTTPAESMAGQSPAPRFSPTVAASSARHDFSREDGQIERVTTAQAARHCRRSDSTIRNLVSKYQLRRRTAWTVRNHLRQRQVLLSPAVVKWLQGITLFRRPPENPPR